MTWKLFWELLKDLVKPSIALQKAKLIEEQRKVEKEAVTYCEDNGVTLWPYYLLKRYSQLERKIKELDEKLYGR